MQPGLSVPDIKPHPPGGMKCTMNTWPMRIILQKVRGPSSFLGLKNDPRTKFRPRCRSSSKGSWGKVPAVGKRLSLERGGKKK